MIKADTAEAPTLSILWLDDLVDNYKSYIRALEQSNLSVTAVADSGRALELARMNDFDLFLVDLRLGGADNGFDFIDAMYKERPDARICVFSSYLYQPEYKRLIRDRRQQIGFMDKNIPSPTSPRFSEFSGELRELARDNTRPDGSTNIQRLIDQSEEDPFSVTYADYQLLDSGEKDKLHLAAEQKLASQLKDDFRAGFLWVLYIGDDSQPLARAKVEEQVWDSDEILELAFEKNRVPFQFRTPIATDDLGFCDGGPPAKTYPTLTLAWNGGTSRKLFRAHFDTGCYPVFLSLEKWLDISGDPNLGFSTVRQYRNMPIITYDKRLELSVCDQEDSRIERAVDVNAVLVKRWVTTPFAVRCPASCSTAEREPCTKGYNCVARQGLIGRRLIADNNIDVVLLAGSLKTSIRQ
jgi:CheY-like chemotaxis protein